VSGHVSIGRKDGRGWSNYLGILLLNYSQMLYETLQATHKKVPERLRSLCSEIRVGWPDKKRGEGNRYSP